ncbi:MAG: beta strand repeat-containing protein [Bacteroidota bacterium]
MKRIYFLLAFFLTTSNLFGQLLTEDFTYTAGQLLTANGWTAHSAGVNPITVTTPGLSYAGHPGSGVGNGVTMANTGEDVNRAYTAVTSGSVYMSFMVNLSAVQTGDYFAGLFQSSSIFPLRVYTKSDGAGGFFFGLSKSNSTASYETTSRTLGTTYFVVVKYTYNTGSTTDDVLDLWVNPALGGTETPGTIAGVTGTSTDATTIGAVFLRQGSSTAASTQQVDAILAGTTWASVTAGASVPSPTLTLGTINSFGNVTTGSNSTSQTISLSGTNLTGAPGNITITAPNTDFQVSSDNSTWGASATIPFTSATLAATSFYVRFTPQTNGLKSGNVSLAGGGASASLAVSGTGVSISAPVATAATAVGGVGFTANWNAVSGATGYFLDVYTKVPGLVTETLAGWAFISNTSTNLINTEGNSNNTGLSISVTGASQTFIHTNVGPSSTNNPYSVTTTGWDAGTNTKFWQVDVSTLGATGITVSSSQLSSNTGPANFKLQYKVGVSGTWADVTGGTVAITASNIWASLTDVLLPADANNQAQVSLRWIQTTDLSVSGAAVGVAGTSRISAIYVKGQVNGFVNTYAQQNINVGNATSYAVTGLTPNSTYYYVVRSTNGVSTSVNSNEISVVTNAAPTLSASTLNAFGNVCTNTTPAPNSFTITGSNLSTANVVVGPLAGFAFGTAAAGPFQSTLSLVQPGGAYSQTVYVQFSPTAVQSYNGNIPVSGGGASSTQVAVTGAGVNTLATVTGGAATSITQTTATVTGTITATGCSSVTAYGVEYSTTSGFANGTGTAVPSSNLSGGSFTSSLSGLAPATTYYYHSYATNAGGTAYSSEQSFTTTNPNPVLSANTLTGFGNVCINTTPAANSFTLTGTNLTSANITVGPLNGYTFSTTVGGTYVASLSITQPGGAFSQLVYVKFTPTSVQSYNGNIPVSGGGASTYINVAVTGAGVSTAPTVVTGSASSITTTGATVAGSITANGCTTVTAYGIEYSTISGFANGSGTQVSSSNLNAGAFTSALSGLTPATTYYYKAYAVNAGGTTWGTQSSFTTSAPPPPQLTVSALASFGSACVNALVGPNTFTINGSNLTASLITVGPLAGYSFSQTSSGSYNNTIGIINPGGTQSYTIYVKFNPTAAQSYNGVIPVTGGGAPTVYVTASGTGANTPATVITGAVSGITTRSAVLAGSIATSGCSNVTAYGIEYSSINGFADGSGTKVPSNNLSGSGFQTSVGGLLQGATYYYKAYATSSAGTAYGAQRSFTLSSIGSGFRIFPSPARPGESVNLTVSLTDLMPGYYGLQFFDASGRMIHVHHMNVQGSFIDRSISLPAHMPIGIYEVRLINFEKELARQRIVIHQ